MRSRFAVGCTYKYLNGGPGSPAFLYVRSDLQERLRQPIWGWFGQRDQFAFGRSYEPAPDIRRYLVGTPPIVSMAAVQVGIGLVAEAGIERLRQKSVGLTSMMVALFDAWLGPLGFELGTHRLPARRGAHLALRHPDGYRICRALIERCKVVPDFRPPDVIRYGPAPIYTRFVDAWDAMERLREAVAKELHLEFDPAPV